MGDIAIRVERLGKQYRLGGSKERYSTLGDQIRKWTSPRQLLRWASRAERRTFWALRDVSFNVKKGEVVGVVGRNGAGKSTMLKLLSRITEPTEGGADIHGRVGSLLEVGTGFHPELTGRENVNLNGAILGMRRLEIARKFDDIVAFAEVEQFIDTPVKHYSSGMYTRLAFAVAAHLEPEILIVDEVLAVGDAEFQKKCLGKMGDVAREGRTILFVSHNMAAVRNLCTRVVLLSGGKVAFDGDTAAGVDAYSLGGEDRDRVAPHILYSAPANSPTGQGTEIEVETIELYGEDGSPRPEARTWEHIRFRVSYKVNTPVRNAHLCIELTDGYGRKLLSLETRTHTGRDDIGLAGGSIVCTIPQLPLAPGSYAVGVAVFVPDQRVIWAGDRLATLVVNPADVFGRGHLPPSSHAAIITPHDWTIVSN